MQKMIPLDQLKFGHEADPPINARKVGRDTDIEELAASIDAHGLINALTVREIGGVAFVAAGNRRLAALRFLVKKGNLVETTLVKCELPENDIAGDELSLAENIQRIPMHEADQYEQFWQLHEKGLTDDQISKRFGYEIKSVGRMLALGKVSPLILDEWRKGEGRFDSEGFAIVAAFTLAPTLKEQEAVFKRLKKSGHIWPRAVREAFGGEDGQAVKNLKFVGKADYEKAGGKVTDDLFGDSPIVADPALLEKLAAAKIETKLKELRGAWAWVSMAKDLPYSWNYSYQKVKGGKNASAEDRAKSGCVVEFKYDGTLEITYGVMKPAAAKAEKAKADKAEGKPAERRAPELSNAQARDLSIVLSQAAQDAVVLNPRVGLVALLAGFASHRSSYEIAAIMVSAEGWNHMNLGHKKEERFDAVFTRLLQMSDEDLFKAAAAACVPAINLTTQVSGAPPLKRKDVAALVDALEPKSIQDALLKHFDPADYFERASRPFVIKAISEAVNADEARKADKLKKAELVKFAVENVGKTGWLPPELRTASYAGPGAAKPKATKAEKPAKAPKLKKAA